MPVLQSEGVCPTCDRDTVFTADDAWLRDHFVCGHCGSIPRERALMVVLEAYYPAWRTLRIHESSPCGRGASVKLAAQCPGYVATQRFPDTPRGAVRDGVRCEDLDALTFPDESIDLHITQDVLEHITHPAATFRELARTLAPGGAHICTVPLVAKAGPSRPRIRFDGDALVHLLPPEYHGNPIDDAGALVTMDWGYDIVEHIYRACGLVTHLVWIDDLRRGIRAELLDVLVTRKPPPP